ncbi:transglutaminase domain-containing protein [Krasilnikovia sp. MM14-A1004]|uniref:transglutaminase domain-containing protein n=1 Tax=Krasilnikovia sp. MM14-A1004 TaxID=3373541 RepID=UPI00399CF41E
MHRRFHGTDVQASPEITALRVTAGDLISAKDWAGFAALRGQLRRDDDYWPDLWGPWSAVAARRVGDPAALELLDEVVTAGFCQPELFDGELAAAFGADPGWAELSARIATNAVAPALVFQEWPVLTPSVPVELLRLPEQREAALRELIPGPADTAWGTAERLLRWVSLRWRHANAHMEIDDAVTCLERVAAGQRFACVEYALVLSQALNALGIPSRRLALRQEQHHVGIARGHVVSEAWIDDWQRWVVLDGQNGWYWRGADGVPLGMRELQVLRQARAGTPTAVVLTGVEHPSDEIDFWFSYFASASTTGAGWAGPGYTPVFQRGQIIPVPRLEQDPARLYPDLSEVGIGIALVDGRAAVELLTAHPYADGFRVWADGAATDVPPDVPRWVLPDADGEHVAEVAVRTRYGALAPRRLRYRIG